MAIAYLATMFVLPMSSTESRAPEFNKQAFDCPLCLAYAKQSWRPLYWLLPNRAIGQGYTQVADIALTVCDHCGAFSVWVGQKLVFPFTMTAPLPHADMSPSIKTDFEEARSVLSGSPRSSAALLRLAIQKICLELGLAGKNLNDDIGELVKRGLPVRIQQSLDIVRVVGNEQVHPGVLDVRDDPAIAMMLFELVNLIVEDRIASPKRIAALYAKLPEEKRKGIEQRDAQTNQP
jgi:hypothetical protein